MNRIKLFPVLRFALISIFSFAILAQISSISAASPSIAEQQEDSSEGDKATANELTVDADEADETSSVLGVLSNLTGNLITSPTITTTSQATEAQETQPETAQTETAQPETTIDRSPQTTSPSEVGTGLFVSIIANPRLNIRQGPSSSFPVIGKLAAGTQVEVIATDETRTWYRVLVQGVPDSGDPSVGSVIGSLTSGWISVNFAAVVPNTAPRPLPETTPAVVEEATTEEATVEDEAISATVVDAPSEDAVAEPEAEPTVDEAAPTTLDVPTAFILPTRMNVRGGPGTVYDIVSTVSSGTGLEILALNPEGDWYQVQVDGLDEPAWVYALLTEATGPLETLQPLSEEEIPPAPVNDEPELEASTETTPSARDGGVSGQAALDAPAVADAPPPSGGGFFGYGVQAHMLGGGAGEALSSTQELGFNWIKQQVEWKLFHSGTGELHGIVGGAESRGINVLFSVVNAPEWARESGFDGSVGGPPADPQTYADFVGRLAGEFCGSGLKAIEVWNEQNLHYEWGNKPLDPVEYMNLLRPSYASIKAACPSMLVISGALTPAGSNPPFAMDDFAYLEGMYQNGLADYSDGIGAHPSGFNVPPSHTWETACQAIQQHGNSFNGACDNPHHSWSFRSTMEGYRNIMIVYGDADKRIWPTEFGWAAGGAFDGRYAYANDNSFDEQANWTVEAYTMMRDWGWVGPAFLWNLNFRVVADGTEKAQWGIVDNKWHPLPIYNSLKAMPK